MPVRTASPSPCGPSDPGTHSTGPAPCGSRAGSSYGEVMPMPERTFPAAVAAGDQAALGDAVDVLCDDSLSHIVDVVAYVDGDGIVVANADGASRITLADVDAPATVLRGRDPVLNQDPLAFSALPAELADPSPPNVRNAYPYAGRRLASVFADPRAP